MMHHENINHVAHLRSKNACIRMKVKAHTNFMKSGLLMSFAGLKLLLQSSRVIIRRRFHQAARIVGKTWYATVNVAATSEHKKKNYLLLSGCKAVHSVKLTSYNHHVQVDVDNVFKAIHNDTPLKP
jgi:hypothetical protein